MEERPPIWRAAANILISSLGQPIMCGPPAWGLGKLLTTPHRKNISWCETKSKPQTWTDTLVRTMQRKRDMRFGTWNVRSHVLDMFRAIPCSSSGGQIVLLQQLVSSLSVSSYSVHRLRTDCSRNMSRIIM